MVENKIASLRKQISYRLSVNAVRSTPLEFLGHLLMFRENTKLILCWNHDRQKRFQTVKILRDVLIEVKGDMLYHRSKFSNYN